MSFDEMSGGILWSMSEGISKWIDINVETPGGAFVGFLRENTKKVYGQISF